MRFSVHGAADEVVVHRADEHLLLNGAVPFESLVGGVKHQLAPSVEDADLEVADHALSPWRETKNIVEAVVLGRGDGVGQPQLEVASLHRVSRRGTASALRGRHAIDPGCRHRDVRQLLASAPQVVRHRRHRHQLRRHPLAEILRQGDDLQCGVNDRQMESEGAVAACLVRERLYIVSGFGIGFPVPNILVTGSLRDFRSFRMVQCQMQRHHRVAAGAVGECFRIVA